MRLTHLAMICSIAIFISSSCGKKQESTFPKEESITNAVYASGVIKSRNQYEAYTKVNGVIESITFRQYEIDQFYATGMVEDDIKQRVMSTLRDAISKKNAANF